MNKEITNCIQKINETMEDSFVDDIVEINATSIDFPLNLKKCGGSYSILGSFSSFPFNIIKKTDPNSIVTRGGYFFSFSEMSQKLGIGSENQEIMTFIENEICFGAPSHYYRAVLPIKNLKMFNFMNIESEMLSLNDGMRNQFVSFSAFDCCVDNNSFDVFKNDDYLLIDCTNEIDEHSFKQQVEYILETIGFFTGVYVHDTIYFFSSEDSTFLNVSFFRSVKLSGSIQFDSFLIGSEKSLNPIVFPNREIESCNRSFVEKRVINSLLAKLMSQHSSNHGIESLLFLLFYSETYALDTRSICLSALFEALRRYLEEHDNRLTASHEENKMNSEECNSFRTALSGHFNQNTIESYAKKCFVIRKPNQKLLIECFDLFGITLDSGDKNAISKRDTFLHGAIPSFDNTHSLEDEARRLYALSIRQFGLCFVLILKIIGYDGLVTNYRKMANYCETNVADDTACMIRI